MNGKIRPSHLERQAYVYLRQSSAGQVEHNQESTKRQYALVDRAKELGWDSSQLQVLDGDLGKSGTSTNLREDFHKLMAAVGFGQVGAVFALEVSRFSRSQADWHRLIDVCALTDTLVVDYDGVYNPNDFNDRVLLGFKGTWSHTELHGMKVRLQGAKLSKAKRGELRCRPPVGYVYDSQGHLITDLDESVVAMVKLFFQKFKEYGSAYLVCKYFSKNKISFPFRSGSIENRLGWGDLIYPRALSILHNPTYAGAYAYGKTREKVTVNGTEVIKKRMRAKSRADWTVLIQNSHPAYISWETFLENEKRITANRYDATATERKGAPREGSALLQGIVVCGRCGSRMCVYYQGEGGCRPSYKCCNSRRHGGILEVCWSVPTKYIDEAVTNYLITVLTKENVSLSLAVVGEIEKTAKDGHKQWDLRIERAKYESERAWRQYDAIDPENRLVARNLEKQWNDKLQALEELKQQYLQHQSSSPVNLTESERTEVLRLCKDFKELWDVSTTTQVERKQILNLLVKQIAIKPVDVPKRLTEIQLLWHTGAHTTFCCPRPKHDLGRRTLPAIIEKIRELSASHTDQEIANMLNDADLKSSKGFRFTIQSVAHIRHMYGIEKLGADPAYAKKGELFKGKYYSVSGLANRLGLDYQVVHYWRRKDVLKGFQTAKGGPWWIELNANDIRALNQRMKKQKLLPSVLQDLLNKGAL